jgi:diadenosine tetraphosphate (Ap4A) HIT family hydrolase
MPRLISRQEAISRLEKEIPHGDCVICNLIARKHKYILHKGKHTTVLLSEYPRCWGQVMVILNRHAVSFSKIKSEEWTELSANVQKATVCVESVLKPLRCYVAATGSSENLLMTSPHIHFNIIPVYHKNDKPSTIFTWEQGVYSGTGTEFEGLLEDLKLGWS